MVGMGSFRQHRVSAHHPVDIYLDERLGTHCALIAVPVMGQTADSTFGNFEVRKGQISGRWRIAVFDMGAV